MSLLHPSTAVSAGICLYQGLLQPWTVVVAEILERFFFLDEIQGTALSSVIGMQGKSNGQTVPELALELSISLDRVL
jgi:hypothetical protein